MIFDCKGMLLWNGINGRFCAFELSERDINPDVFEHIGELTKERVDPCQAFADTCARLAIH